MSDSSRGPERSHRTVMALGLVTLLLVGTGGVVTLAPGLFGGTSDVAADATPVAQGESGGASDGDDHSSSSGDTERPFTIDTKQIERCGKTCRDVTVSLTNNGNHTREGISVETEIYAGKRRVWEGQASVGSLGSDASTTRTARVKIGFVDAAKIKQNGGTVTIETVVDWDGGSETFRERRQVA